MKIHCQQKCNHFTICENIFITFFMYDYIKQGEALYENIVL